MAMVPAGIVCRLSQINIGELKYKVTVCFMDCSGIEFDPQLHKELLQGQGNVAQRA